MTQVRTYVCEVCGARKRLASKGWYLVLENQWHDNLEILVWDDELAMQPEMMHLCCSEHVQLLVSEWMQPGQGSFATQIASSASHTAQDELRDFRRAALQLGRLSVDRAMLAAQTGESHQSLMAVLDAIEIALKTGDLSAPEDTEEDPIVVFDA